MALKPCRECGKDVSTTVMRCPQCGARTAYGDTNLRGCTALALLVPLFCVVLLFRATSDVASVAPAAAPVASRSCLPASGRIEIGTNLYYDIGGGTRTFAGTVTAISDHDFGNGRVRSVQVRLSDGSLLWRERNPIATDANWRAGPGC